MPNHDAQPPRAIQLDELIALNDEIASLVRAGVPLEHALGELSGDLPGRLGRIAAEVAQRSERGESLLDITSGQAIEMPPVYRAVVEAGLRTGRLPAALETLSGSIRRVAQTRRSVATAALYPLLVLTIAWSLFAFLTRWVVPELLSSFDQLDVPGRGLLVLMTRWGRWAGVWGPAVPAVILIAAVFWWLRSGRANIVQPHQAARLLGWLPWMGKMLRWSYTATFAEVLTLLVESRMPLDQAVVLAAEASGDRSAIETARQMAQAIARGESFPRADEPRKKSRQQCGFPPLLTWLMMAGRRHDALLPALRHAADTYRRRAAHQAELARIFLPVLLTLTIGGTVTLLYVLALFIPYTSMLRSLGGL